MGRMTSKQRDVLQLLKDYRAWHTPYGGAISPDESEGVAETSYGPAGYIEAGMAFEKHGRSLLAESMALLDEALGRLARENFVRWYVLREPYLDDAADSSLVDHWRAWAPQSDTCAAKLGLHDKAIATLAEYLEDVDLYPVYPKLMSEKERHDMARQNAEAYAIYQRVRVAGNSERKSAEMTADALGPAWSADAVERLVEFRDDIRLDKCIEEHCDREPERGMYCIRHYMQERRKNRNAS